MRTIGILIIFIKRLFTFYKEDKKIESDENHQRREKWDGRCRHIHQGKGDYDKFEE